VGNRAKMSRNTNAKPDVNASEKGLDGEAA
jgi:hypothetical protein